MTCVGTTLKNGATIVAQKNDTVLAVTHNGVYSEYIVWAVDAEGNTFHGNYFPIPHVENAFDQAVERFKKRAG